MANLDYFYEIIKENDYKLTKQRKAILEIFLENEDKHMTAEEVHRYIVVNNPEIGLATVYRNVQLLSELNILNELILDDGFTRYELILNKENSRHHHLICNNCGKIIEVQEDLMESIEKILDKNYDFLVSDHQAKFFGFCKKCREEE